MEKQIEDVTITAQWALDYIREYQKTGENFDPFAVLTDTENRQQKLFRECCDFLDDLETITNRFIDTRKKHL